MPGAKCWPAGVSTERSARKTSWLRTTCAAGQLDDRDRQTEGVVGRSQPRQVLEKADERLRVVEVHAHVHLPRERRLVQPRAGLRKRCDGGLGAPRPGRLRRRVVADLVDLRRGRVDVRPELPARPQRVHEDRVVAGGKDPFADVDVPGVEAAPADQVARVDLVPDLDECVHVLVAEVPDVDEPPDSVWRGAPNLATFDRVHAMRPPGRGPRLWDGRPAPRCRPRRGRSPPVRDPGREVHEGGRGSDEARAPGQPATRGSRRCTSGRRSACPERSP